MKPTPAGTERLARAVASRPSVAGIALSHPERLIFSDLSISKLDLARYYEHIADWVMPQVGGRPVKTTGGRGLHVVVPIVPARDWSQCLAYARDVSEAIVRTDPRLYTTAFAKRDVSARFLSTTSGTPGRIPPSARSRHAHGPAHRCRCLSTGGN